MIKISGAIVKFLKFQLLDESKSYCLVVNIKIRLTQEAELVNNI